MQVHHEKKLVVTLEPKEFTLAMKALRGTMTQQEAVEAATLADKMFQLRAADANSYAKAVNKTAPAPAIPVSEHGD